MRPSLVLQTCLDGFLILQGVANRGHISRFPLAEERAVNRAGDEAKRAKKVQEKGKNIRREARKTAYEKALKLYLAEGGSVPVTPESTPEPEDEGSASIGSSFSAGLKGSSPPPEPKAQASTQGRSARHASSRAATPVGSSGARRSPRTSPDVGTAGADAGRLEGSVCPQQGVNGDRRAAGETPAVEEVAREPAVGGGGEPPLDVVVGKSAAVVGAL